MSLNPEFSQESAFAQTTCCDTIAAQILQGLRQEGDDSIDGVKTREEVTKASANQETLQEE